MIQEDEGVGREEEYKPRVTFTSEKTGKTYQYKPAQPGKQIKLRSKKRPSSLFNFILLKPALT